MNKRTRQVVSRLLIIAVLIGVLVAYRYPSLWPQAPVDPIEPVDPVEPVDPIEPIDPTEPAKSIVSLTGEYYTYDQMKQQLYALQARYPERLTVGVCGSSADGRDICYAVLGSPDAPGQIIVTAGMHAREYVNCYVVMQQLEYYLRNYDTGTYEGVSYEELFSRVSIVVVPMTNPDGIMLAQQGMGALSSTTLFEGVKSMLASLSVGNNKDGYLNENWKSNARGVDINRNFNTRWSGYSTSVSYTSPTFKEYKGTAPESEPETKALVALTHSLGNLVASICVHSQGNVIYWRADQTGALEQKNLRLAQLAAQITGYTINGERQTEPSYSNWTVDVLHIPTITVENGVGGYPQSYDMAGGFFDRNCDLWAAVAKEFGLE